MLVKSQMVALWGNPKTFYQENPTKMIIKAKLKRDWGFFHPTGKIYANFIVLNIELSVNVEVNTFTRV